MLAGEVYFAVGEEIVREVDGRVAEETARFTSEFQKNGLARLAEHIRARQAAGAPLDYWLEDSAGRSLAGGSLSLKAADGAYHEGWTTKLAKTEYKGDEPDFSVERALVTKLGDGSFLVVGDELGDVEKVRHAVLVAFGWALAATVLVGACGGLFLSAVFLRPIDAMITTAREIEAGDLGKRIPLAKGGADLQRLADAFNRMLDRIATLIDANKQVSSAIAHDLRKPLARVLRGLEQARTGPAGIAEYEKAVDVASTDIHGVLETFNALLRIAQIESGSRRANFRDIDLAAIALEVAEAFRPAATDEGKTLSLDLDTRLPIVGDRELLTQLAANLIDNAIRHTPHGAHIQVKGVKDEAGARLIVADDGPGVPAAERDRIFGRFYRLDNARTTPGDGLGLSLVAAIAELHGAKVSTLDNGPGLKVAVDLARPNPAS